MTPRLEMLSHQAIPSHSSPCFPRLPLRLAGKAAVEPCVFLFDSPGGPRSGKSDRGEPADSYLMNGLPSDCDWNEYPASPSRNVSSKEIWAAKVWAGML